MPSATFAPLLAIFNSVSERVRSHSGPVAGIDHSSVVVKLNVASAKGLMSQAPALPGEAVILPFRRRAIAPDAPKDVHVLSGLR